MPTPRPNFFIIGAMKAGTSSLNWYLSHHPEVFMCTPKEPGYFAEQVAWSRGLDWYLSLFAAAGKAKVIGEGSTHYAKLPVVRGVPERIRDFNPDARFVYLMRDPLERMVSHYWHVVRNLGHEAEGRDFATAVREDPGYVGFSDYAMQLRPYFDLFGRDRVMCLTFEELIANPAQVTGDILSWLGLENRVPSEVFKERSNVRPEVVRRATGRGVLNRIAYSRGWSMVAPLVPKPLRRFAKARASEVVATTPDVTAPVLDHWRPVVRERVAELCVLLGRTFPEWKTLHNGP